MKQIRQFGRIKEFVQQHTMLCVWGAVLSLSGYFLYLPSETGAALLIPPDSSEYAIGLVNLFEHGTFGITLNGEWYPCRYSPWFSISCLTPAYFLGLGDALKLSWAIWAFALTVIFVICKWGEFLGLGWKSVFPAVMLLLMPDFVFYSRIVMTEIPYVAIYAITGLIFVLFDETSLDSRGSWKLVLVCGSLIAWGGMVRPTMLPMSLLFICIIVRKGGWRMRTILLLAILLAPTMLYECANLAYNAYVFGNPFRSGYQYWMPVPCDFPHLLFNWGYVVNNLIELSKLPMAWATIILVVCVNIGLIIIVKSRKTAVLVVRRYFLFLLFLDAQMIILAVLYIGYYWVDIRFFLPITICALPLLFAICHEIARRHIPVIGRCCVMVTPFLLVGLFLAAKPKYYRHAYSRQAWMAKAAVAAQVLPEGAVVLQGGDPNILEQFGFRSKRLILMPYERRFDYVKNMIAPTSIRNTRFQPTSYGQRNIPELVEDGTCKLPFERTFLEDPRYVRELIERGNRVFLEQDALWGEENWPDFQSRLTSVGLKSYLFGVWQVGAIDHDVIRGIYDSLLFRDFRMDSRPDVTAVYHEIIPLN